jgi:hypothetical protein
MTAQQNSNPKTVVGNRASPNSPEVRLQMLVLLRPYDNMVTSSMSSNIRSSRDSHMEQMQRLIETIDEVQKILMSDEGDDSSGLFSFTFSSCQ